MHPTLIHGPFVQESHIHPSIQNPQTLSRSNPPNPRRLISPHELLSLAAAHAAATHAARFRRAPATRSTLARSPWSAAPSLARVLHPLLFVGIRHGRPRRGQRYPDPAPVAMGVPTTTAGGAHLRGTGRRHGDGVPSPQPRTGPMEPPSAPNPSREREDLLLVQHAMEGCSDEEKLPLQDVLHPSPASTMIWLINF